MERSHSAFRWGVNLSIKGEPDNWRPWYYRAQLLEKVSGANAAMFDAKQAAERDPLGLAGAYAARLATAQ